MTFPAFAEFHTDVHEIDPYPWQEALAERLVTDGGRWPEHVDVPAGLGTTACVDIAVWHLARQLSVQAAGGPRRTAPMRIVHLTDHPGSSRTSAHLRTVHEHLSRPRPGSPTEQVREALATAAGGGPAIAFEAAQQAPPDHEAWVPGHGPAVMVTTPHEFVARLLWRAPGVTPAMAAVQAGLAGLDRLVLFDQPHLSGPAIDTIRAQQDLQAGFEQLKQVPAGQLVLLGSLPPHRREPASPPRATALGGRHGLSAADHAHPRARQILTAPRTAVLHPSGSSDKAVRAALVKTARAATAERVLVFCNTSRMAQHVHADLETTEPGSTLLLTARFRPADRARLDDALTGWEQDPQATRYVVTTQVLETGDDMSASEVVTEACDWPALQLRAGHCNRYGKHDTAAVHVVTGIRKATTAIYARDAIARTLDLLEETVNLSLHSQAELDSDARWSPPLPAPTLHAGLLGHIAHTRPRPVPDIDPVAFATGLHPDSPAADVQVAWRTVVTTDAITACPPRAEETIQVPAGAARALLRAAHRDDYQDLDFSDATPAPRPGYEHSSFEHDRELPPGLVLAGDASQDWHPIHHPSHITPGSLVVLPAQYGGYTPTHGWKTSSRATVPDLAARGSIDGWRFWLNHDTLPVLEATFDNLNVAALAEALEETDALIKNKPVDEPDTTELAKPVAAALGIDPAMIQIAIQPDAYLIETTAPAQPVPALADHARDVATRARRIGENFGLTDQLLDIVQEAGLRHADGKAWPPYQRYLCGPAHLQHHTGQDHDLLAWPRPDSGAELPDADLYAGLPRRWRHETRAARTLVKHDAPEEVIHLVTAHHGWTRPLLPPAPDPAKPGIDANHLPGTADRFEHLNNRYGPWGLALLETVVRLADHAARTRTPHDKIDTPPTA